MRKRILWVLFLFLLTGYSQVFAQNVLEEQQKKFQEMLNQVAWKNLSIDFYEVKDKPGDGFKSMTVKSTDAKNGFSYYVSKKSILSLKNMKSMDVLYSAGDDDKLRLVIRFNDEGKRILSEYSKAHINERMGVVIDGKLRLVANLLQPLTNGRVQVYGFDPGEAVSVLKRYYEPKLEVARKFNASVAVPAAAKKP